MAVSKLSQIATTATAPAAADFLVGVTSANVDHIYTINQIGQMPSDSTSFRLGNGALAVGGDVNSLAIGAGAAASLEAGDTGNFVIGANALNTASNTAGSAFVLRNLVIGTNAMKENLGGVDNLVIGSNAFRSAIGTASATNNIVIGKGAMSDGSMTSPTNNIAIGPSAMENIVDASGNIAIGSSALKSNNSNTGNVAIGNSAAFSLQADNNVAIGNSAMQNATGGGQNVAIGFNALLSNTSGNSNVAVGVGALQTNTTGVRNFGLGETALTVNDTGDDNVAIGQAAMESNVDGSANIAIGHQALDSNISGNNNVAVGDNAGQTITGSNNILIGRTAGKHMTSGNYNVILGAFDLNGGATTTPSNSFIFSDGQGNLELDYNLTNSSKWTFTNAWLIGPTEAVLEETGDELGGMRMRVRNRTGFNGVLLDNPSNDVTEFILTTASAGQANWRFEYRDSSMVCAANKLANGGVGEHQLILGVNDPYAIFGQEAISFGPGGTQSLDYNNTNTSVWTFSNTLVLKPTTIASLPGSPVLGQIASITDGDGALAWGATAVNSGAGATKYLVWYNGSNWKVFGK